MGKKRFLAFALCMLMLCCAIHVSGLATGAADEIDTSGLVLKHYTRNQGTENLADNEAVLEYIENAVGFQIDVYSVPSDQYNDKMKMVLASGEKFDSFNVLALGESTLSLRAKDAIIPINDLLEQYGQNILNVVPQEAFDVMTDKDGQIWGMPRRERYPTGNQPAIREDWCNMLGMDIPSSFVEFEEFMQAVLDNDLNGNGIQDEIPLMPMAGTAGITLDFRGMFCGVTGGVYITEDDVVMPIRMHPGYKDMLAKFAEWYDKGYIWKEFNSDSDAKKNEYKNANRVACYCNWFQGGDSTFKQVEGCLYSPMPPFTDAPSGTPGWGSNAQYTPMVYLSSTGDNPFLMIKLIDWLCSDPANAVTQYYGLEGKHWDWIDQAANTITLLDNYSDSYNQFYHFIELFYPTYFPAIETDDPLLSDRNRVAAITKDWFYYENNSTVYVFNTAGTEAEFLTGDGGTLLDETFINIIYGVAPIDDWDKAVEQYWALEGETYSKVYTEQYLELYK